MTQIIDLGKLRFNFAGQWLNTTEYAANDVVKYGGNVYVYIYGLKSSGALPTDTSHWALMVQGISFEGPFVNGTSYQVGDGVAYGGKVYVAILDSTNVLPTNSTYWSQFVDGIQYEGTYSGATGYQKNDVVKYGGSIYIALQDTTNNLPTNTTYWARFVEGISAQGVYNAAVAYIVGDVVAYGANVYRAIVNTTAGDLPTNATKFELLTSGLLGKGAWTIATNYLLNDVVTYGGNSYRCLVGHASGVFATDLTAAKWIKFSGGIRSRGTFTVNTAYLTDDVVSDGTSTFIVLQDYTSGAATTAEADRIAGKLSYLAQGAAGVPVISATVANRRLSNNGTTATWVGPKGTFATISTTTTVVSNTQNLIDTSALSFTVTLPVAPTVDDVIMFVDYTNTWNTNPLIIAGNGKQVGGDSSLRCDIKGASIELLYTTAKGWVLI